MNKPKIDKTAVVLMGAVVVGNVSLGAECSVWHNAVLRGDDGAIQVGAGTNIQDGCILHAAVEHAVNIGSGVTVGHGCILHGCTIHNNALIGMGSIVMDGAEVGENSIVGAGSLVAQGTNIPAGWLAFGRPAKLVRKLTQDEITKNSHSAQEYIAKAKNAVGK